MRRLATTTVLLSAAVLGTGLLAGCSSSSSSSSSPSAVGGMTTCDEPTLTSAVQKAYPDNSYANLKVSCADGWAAVTVDQSASKDMANAINVTYVFEAEGQFWIPKDRAAVCGTIDTNAPATRPADAQVPEAIWATACNTN